MPPFDPDPLIVILMKGSMITVERSGKPLARNALFFKKVDLPMSSLTMS